MKSDGACIVCGTRIRWAQHKEGETVMLNRDADVNGDWGVVAWKRGRHALSTPIIERHPTGPTETPMRYRRHECSDA